jgi:hypothetical protein
MARQKASAKETSGRNMNDGNVVRDPAECVNIVTDGSGNAGREHTDDIRMSRKRLKDRLFEEMFAPEYHLPLGHVG